MAQTQHLDIDAALKAEEDRLTSRKQELEAELTGINQRLGRIARYFTDEPAPTLRHKAATARSAERHPRGFVQQTVLKTITRHPQGMTTAELIKELGPQAIGQQSIANALGALVQQTKITSQGRGGKYLCADPRVPTAPDQPSS